ncbi:C4-dicarboxylate transport transcriptional regulatory protein DctD [Vibrio stylophorae]|uniref:C4-dicarboxylate transport transcriptional regulatory protein DctD n=1 Tax=Vibrio stylophorae TaxID=659351 RepID=A0ABM8ZY91_9VIBR|nr:sigma-54 dependent transcriptional regulator [Vibrio stylophorae]CAH0535806.1 C4-dicarboxylate transport transcriptional regulatory protein DctD [Vibrio stylophorae]
MNRVIFIDDEPSIRHALSQTLELADYNVQCFANASLALEVIDETFGGVIISDINMPGMDGIRFLKEALKRDQELQVILLTGHGDISTAVDAMRIGAYDFLEKPFSTEHLLEVVRRAADKRQLHLENRSLRQELAAQSGPGPRLLGNTPQIIQLRRILTHIKDTPADVLVYGETGSGKELVARFLHDHSVRHEKPFVAINCGAIPESMMESELFGHESGAFTGANKKRIGKIAYANGGTLFLDEIESMPMALQIKLLRVLEERKVEPLGSNQAIDLNIRIIAATKTDLKALGDTGEFRPDLYYRLNVVKVDIPALRERKDDILLLFKSFTRAASLRYGFDVPELSLSLQQQLLAHDWPGNVRELRNFAERYTLMGEEAAIHEIEPLAQQEMGLSFTERVEQLEFTLLCDALKRHHGRLKEVQMELALPRKSLYDKMKKYGLDKQDFKHTQAILSENV